MGEYQGRRRGRSEAEPRYVPEPEPYYREPPAEQYQQPEYGYFDPEPPAYEYGDGYDGGHDDRYADGDEDDDEYAGPNYRDTVPDHTGVDYAEPRVEAVRRRNETEPAPAALRKRPASSETSPLVAIIAASGALAVAALVSPQAVAVVAVALQAAVAIGWLSLTGAFSRPAAVLAMLPALGADAATFHFRSDSAATAVAAALGAGFVLCAADAVVRASRRGVESGAGEDLAASVTTMLLTCMTALVVIAARLSATCVVAAAVLAGLTAFFLSRRPGADRLPRTALIGLSFAAAAIASYAAAILLA